MFLYYTRQNEFASNIFKPVYGVTEALTSMALCVWDNFNYNMIVFILLIIVIYYRRTKN
jgi:hypothetical protein